MGKKGRWLSAIKRVFIPNSKEKLPNRREKKSSMEKKWGLGRLRHGENNFFIPLCREPSSIEEILGDAERENQKTRLKSSKQHQMTPPSMPSRIVNHHKETSYNPAPTSRNHCTSAIKIQAAYRGYTGRKSFRAQKGLVRLQGVVRGQSVNRQIMNAMRYMQLLVRVQSQIHTWRIHKLEDQAFQRQNLHDKDMQSSLGKRTLIQRSETGHQEEWDDSLLTKEEIDSRLQRKVEAVIKRERALAYTYSNRLWKTTSKSPQTAAPMEIRLGGFPWCWNWFEQQLPRNLSESQATTPKTDLTPAKLIWEPNPGPQSRNIKQPRLGFEDLETLTPTSSKSMVVGKAEHVSTLSERVVRANSSTPEKHGKLRTKATESLDVPLREDESLASCPPFSVPNYMAPTISAKAKVRNHSNPKDSLPAIPNHQLKKRFSFPLAQNIGSSRWNRGSLFENKDSSKQKHDSMQFIDNSSIDSTISLPVGVGRKPFKRFV